LHMPAHIRGGPRHDLVGGGDVLAPGGIVRNLGHYLPAPLAPDLNQEDMAGLVEELGQRDVEAGVGLRAGAHGHAETGAAGLTAVGGDDKGARPPGLVVRVDIGPAEEEAILDTDRMEVAGARR
jgi:hypothetical protein